MDLEQNVTRLNKAYNYKRSKLTMDVEIDNTLDHQNWRYYGLRQCDFSTGQAWMRRDTMLPILPSSRFTLDFLRSAKGKGIPFLTSHVVPAVIARLTAGR